MREKKKSVVVLVVVQLDLKDDVRVNLLNLYASEATLVPFLWASMSLASSPLSLTLQIRLGFKHFATVTLLCFR